MTVIKKKNRRQKEKYPNLKPEFNLKIRYEEVADLSYYKKLPEAEKEWLNKFAGEYINAAFDKNTANRLQNDDQRRECYRRNNYRNKDMFSKVRAQGKTVSFEDLVKKRVEYEDFIIGKIDSTTDDDNEDNEF